MEQALGFFLGAAWPDAAYEATCRTWLAVSVASAGWDDTIRRALEAAAAR